LLKTWNNNKINGLVINSLPVVTIKVDDKSYALNSVVCHTFGEDHKYQIRFWITIKEEN